MKTKTLYPLTYNKRLQRFDSKGVIIGNVADPQEDDDVATYSVLKEEQKKTISKIQELINNKTTTVSEKIDTSRIESCEKKLEKRVDEEKIIKKRISDINTSIQTQNTLIEKIKLDNNDFIKSLNKDPVKADSIDVITKKLDKIESSVQTIKTDGNKVVNDLNETKTKAENNITDIKKIFEIEKEHKQLIDRVNEDCSGIKISYLNQSNSNGRIIEAIGSPLIKTFENLTDIFGKYREIERLGNNSVKLANDWEQKIKNNLDNLSVGISLDKILESGPIAQDAFGALSRSILELLKKLLHTEDHNDIPQNDAPAIVYTSKLRSIKEHPIIAVKEIDFTFHFKKTMVGDYEIPRNSLLPLFGQIFKRELNILKLRRLAITFISDPKIDYHKFNHGGFLIDLDTTEATFPITIKAPKPTCVKMDLLIPDPERFSIKLPNKLLSWYFPHDTLANIENPRIQMCFVIQSYF